MPSENSGAAELHNILDEICVLNEATLRLIRDAMHNGIDHNYRGKWRTQNFSTHIEHAIMHLLSLKNPKEGDEEDHLSHALCRLAMAATMEFDKIEEDSDDVNRWESEGGAEVGPREAMGEYKFENGQAVNHPSGLEPRQQEFGGTPGPHTKFWHARCGTFHHAYERCEGIL